MAKVSRVNIAITGDSKGLAAATDAATKELRRLQVATERTQKRIGAMRGTTNQAAESLAKFGVQSRALGAAGGALGLLGLGPAGIALGAAGLGIGAAAAGVQAIAGITEQRRQASSALEAIRMDRRRRIEEFGLTTRLAEGLQGTQTTGVAGQLGLMGGFGAGLGAATRQGAVLETILSQGPGALGVFYGQRIGGATETQAGQAALETIFGEGSTGMVNQLQFGMDILNAQSGPVAWARDFALWWSK